MKLDRDALWEKYAGVAYEAADGYFHKAISRHQFNALLDDIERQRGEPDGYAVVMKGGGFVGIWTSREIAESVCNRSQAKPWQERVVPMVFATPSESSATGQRWAVFCPKCDKQWAVDTPHRGKELCAQCSATGQASPSVAPADSEVRSAVGPARPAEQEKKRCTEEWSNVNDPPCHPSDPDWKPCNLCDGSAEPQERETPMSDDKKFIDDLLVRPIDTWVGSDLMRLLGIASRSERELSQAREQIAFLHTCGIIELAIRNPNVSSYVNEWEGRAERAEQRLAECKKKSAGFIEELKQKLSSLYDAAPAARRKD